jgi:hypothetical protein
MNLRCRLGKVLSILSKLREVMKKVKGVTGFEFDDPELQRMLKEAADEILRAAREYGPNRSGRWNHDEANRILIAPNAPINTSIFEEAEIVAREM